MSQLLSCLNLSKAYGSRTLFEGISLTVAKGDRVGMIGPNGAGKSTLLAILAGRDTPDAGTVAVQRGTRVAYLEQSDDFSEDQSVAEVLRAAVAAEQLDDAELRARLGAARSMVGLQDLETKVGSLSGGWRKRLAFAARLVQQPDLFLLDEPTNHLDMEGILWLESLIINSPFAVVLVSHDRTFLENVTTRVVEINRRFPRGYFAVDGNYTKFLAKREEYLVGMQQYEASLANRVRREIEWLRRGAKARTTKATARIKEAERLIDELAEAESRRAGAAAAALELNATGRQTKRLIAAEQIGKSVNGRKLFSELDIVLAPGVRLGLLGPNGSGKSTLLKVLAGELPSDEGRLERAPELRIAVFDQNRAQLDQNVTLRRALAPEGDAVVFRGTGVHVAAWAKRFLFRPEQLDTLVGDLSGGEQARVLIANIMREPADVLLLDEPTNDLDIETLEVLEESLLEFPGAVVLVTHDRYLLERVSTLLVGLDGKGGSMRFASLAQWEQARSQVEKDSAPARRTASTQDDVRAERYRHRLSYKEKRELEQMEERLLEAEAELTRWQERLADPALASDAGALVEAGKEVQAAQERLDRLFERWSELEARERGSTR